MFDAGIPESAIETARRVLESCEGASGGTEGRKGENDVVDGKSVVGEELG